VVSQMMKVPPPASGLNSRRLAAWVDGLQARGSYTFTRGEAAEAHGRSDLALTKVLGRLVRKGRIVSPRLGFYVIVPAEYLLAGAPPASWFVHDLMGFIGHPYYVGLLSAAALHGAAHQQPQVFQVVSDVALRPAEAGPVHIQFVKKERLTACPIVQAKTSTGTMRVGTPEVTALDLVRYPKVAGHLDNVATVLCELGEVLNAGQLVVAAEVTGVELSVVQRLGYLLDLVGPGEPAGRLSVWLAEREASVVPLRPGRPTRGAPTDRRWRVRINEQVEPDL